MAIDAKDVGELQKALNDASGKASALWIAFVTFELYLAIAFGAVTHRSLFLENPIKLPVLNVDLPLVGFFVVAPTILLIFHFYIFLQLLALARKAADFNTLLTKQAPNEINSQFLRHRLDSFLMLQFLAGPAEQRTGYTGVWLRLIAWITLVGAPIIILLQAQVTFLPYHLAWVQWLLRICILIDLAVIWCLWNPVRSEDQPILKWISTRAWRVVGGLATAVVVAFSILLATFPGEFLNDYFAMPFREALFVGEVDEVDGRPRSLFSNRLVVTDQSFVDPEEVDKIEVSHSFRGRDLRQAVLNRVDLRKADFTGAMLNGASLEGAKLQNARFGCANRTIPQPEYPGSRRWPDDGCTWLQGASLRGAHLQSVRLGFARIEGEKQRAQKVAGPVLHGAALDEADLRGADLTGAELSGATLKGARLEGANLRFASLGGADLRKARLQGAYLPDARLQFAALDRAMLQGAYINGAELHLASLAKAQVWRTWFGSTPPEIYLTDIDELDEVARPWMELTTFFVWRDSILKAILVDEIRTLATISLSVLDPSKEPNEILVAGHKIRLMDKDSWSQETERLRELSPTPPQGDDRKKKLADRLIGYACAGSPFELGYPFIVRGILRNGRTEATGIYVKDVASALRRGKSNLAACPGVEGFTERDWTCLDTLVDRATRKSPAKQDDFETVNFERAADCTTTMEW
jgi:uncharacterized protein YjbI with pentapeptide repeats